MKQVSAFSWTCPACGRTELVARSMFFDAALHPAEAAQIKEGTYFTIRCPSCGETEEFLMNMLYMDRVRQFMISLEPEENVAHPPVDSAMAGTTLRIVRDSEDLADKVRQMESSIDDRIIEIAEYLLYRKIRPALPAGSVMGMPVFHDGEVPSISLPMEIKGKGYAMGTDRLTAERIRELTETYGAALAADQESGFRLIDRAYAKRIVDAAEA